MKRIALALTVMAVLVFSAGAAQAGHHGHHGHHRGHHHGPPPKSRFYVPPHFGPRVIYPPPVVRSYYGPAWVAPPYAYPYRPYYAPRSGVYYRGSGISIGIGF